MKLWGIIRKGSGIHKDIVLDTEYVNRDAVNDWGSLVGHICQALDLARPVMLNKHVHDLQRFSRTVFTQEDFMEPIFFDKFELVIFSQNKKS